MKSSFIILASAFGAACVGLWGMMELIVMLLRAWFPEKAQLGPFHLFCLGHYSILLWLPFPAIVYAVYVSIGGKATIERFCLFASMLALVLICLGFTVVVMGMSCGIPFYEHGK